VDEADWDLQPVHTRRERTVPLEERARSRSCAAATALRNDPEPRAQLDAGEACRPSQDTCKTDLGWWGVL